MNPLKKFVLAFLFTACTIYSNAQSIQLDSGLVAFYPFESTFLDSSGKGHHGTAYDLSFMQGHCGTAKSAIYLNGETGYMEVADHADLRGPVITFAYWATIYSSEASVVFGKSIFESALQEQYSMAYNYYKISEDERSVGFHWGIKETGYCTSPGYGWDVAYSQKEQALNTWLFVVASFDGDSIKIYVNGKQIASEHTTYKRIADCAGGTLRIGKWWKNYPSPFYGLLDDFRIYNRALTFQEINALYMDCPLVTSTDESSKDNPLLSLTLFPNPIQSGLAILKSSSVSPFAVKLYNEMGIPLKEFTIPFGSTSLNLVDYPNGIYFLKTDKQTLKFIKQ